MLCKTEGESGAYLTSRLSTTSIESESELDGQCAGTRWFSRIAGGSLGTSRYSTARSTELSFVLSRGMCVNISRNTYFKDSSSSVTLLQVQYMFVENVIALKMVNAAYPTGTYPAITKRVDPKTLTAPNTSKLTNSPEYDERYTTKPNQHGNQPTAVQPPREIPEPLACIYLFEISA